MGGVTATPPKTNSTPPLPSTSSRPFLRWQGSKRRVARSISALLASPRGTYVEPFLGGGSVFFEVRPNAAFLCDSLEPLVGTYIAVRNDPQGVSAHLAAIASSSCTYYDVRKHMSSLQLGTPEHAGAFIYLNAHCFNVTIHVAGLRRPEAASTGRR
ncbi:MAG: DNA adenine methylase [Acidimicrobiales bacterium]